MGRLIVNADDFGLTGGVNRAIVELHRDGLLTSTTLMARGAAAYEAIRLGCAMPSMGVGCHVVLADGIPVLPPQQIPTLADRQSGRFSPAPALFLQRLFAGRIHSAEIEAEAAAQIALLQALGLALTHIDTHKHLHMFPAILRPVLRAARAAGIRAVRNPFEPAWSRRATPDAPWIRRTQVSLLRRFEPAFRRIVAQEGFVTTDGSIGVLATGTLDARTVRSLLQALPPGTWELVTHPGYSDSDLAQAGTRLLAARETEHGALQALKQFPNLELISYAVLDSGRIP